VPLDLEIIETYRQEISTELKRVVTGEMRANRRKPAAVRPVSEKAIAPSPLRAQQRPHN
jgi:hypothetical protein